MRVLLSAGLVDAGVLLQRIEALPLNMERKHMLMRWVETTVQDIGAS